MSRAAVSGFSHILHRSGSTKGRGGPLNFAPRGVSRAGQLREPQGARHPGPQSARRGPAWVRPPPLPAPSRTPAPTRSARGRPAPPGPLPPLPTAGARSRTATPEGTGSCLTSGGTSSAVSSARRGIPHSRLSWPRHWEDVARGGPEIPCAEGSR